ncbi:dihydropteroate synthase [Arcanobacterium hippocoleae]
MGILNVTPDSFSDGGLWAGADAAIAHGYEMVEQGAQIIDIGGESTRPGAGAVSAAEEWERIGAVVAELSQIAQVSVDTYHAQTARRAVAAGAAIVNDVSGGRLDPQMLSTISELDCRYILQHSRGTFNAMNSFAVYDGNINDVIITEMLALRDKAVASGIAPERIILDPGLGFSKIGDQDWQILQAAAQYLDLGHELLIGQSRKRFLAAAASEGVPAHERDYATAAISGILSEVYGEVSGTGVWAVRVHNVEATRQAIETHRLLRTGSGKQQRITN